MGKFAGSWCDAVTALMAADQWFRGTRWGASGVEGGHGMRVVGGAVIRDCVRNELDPRRPSDGGEGAGDGSRAGEGGAGL